MEDFIFDPSDCFSDLYKDVHGFRPRQHEFFEATEERKQEIYDDLCNELELEEIRREEARLQADIAFETRILGCIVLGAEDRHMAIRWIFQSDDVTAYDLAYGYSYVAWKYGVSDAFRDEVKESMLEEKE